MKKSDTAPVPDHQVESLPVIREKIQLVARKALSEPKFGKRLSSVECLPLAENVQRLGHALPKNLPIESYSPRAQQSLTAADRVLLVEYLGKLEQACANIGTSASKITVDTPPDPEEGVRRIVVTSHFDVDANTAFSYWDIIGKVLDSWASGPDADTAAAVLGSYRLVCVGESDLPDTANVEFDPIAFLDLANEPSQSDDESKLRAAVGRAYYAIFLLARERMRITSQDRIHATVS